MTLDAGQQSAYRPKPGDLERKLRHIFPNEGLREAARAQLLRYGREGWHHEPERVRLAILKLAGDDLVAVDQQIETAGVDYRDILAQAEYPAYSKLPAGIDPTRPEAVAAMNSDRQQYLDWIQGN